MHTSLIKLKSLNRQLDELIEVESTLHSKTEIIFYSTTDVAKFLGISKGQAQKLFNRNDFPSCNYFKSQKIERNALIKFLTQNQENNEHYKTALEHIQQGDIND